MMLYRRCSYSYVVCFPFRRHVENGMMPTSRCGIPYFFYYIVLQSIRTGVYNVTFSNAILKYRCHGLSVYPV